MFPGIDPWTLGDRISLCEALPADSHVSFNMEKTSLQERMRQMGKEKQRGNVDPESSDNVESPTLAPS